MPVWRQEEFPGAEPRSVDSDDSDDMLSSDNDDGVFSEVTPIYTRPFPFLSFRHGACIVESILGPLWEPIPFDMTRDWIALPSLFILQGMTLPPCLLFNTTA